MKRKTFVRFCLALILGTATALPQLTTSQREADFQQLASLYARYYAPANWKIQALGVNIFDLSKWMPRVRAAKSDKEYFQVATEYVASFQDGHTVLYTPSQFVADAGIFVDLYDGKVLLEDWDRAAYPAAAFDWRIGDELISLDGRPAEELIREIAKTIGYGNPKGTLRLAAERLTMRRQEVYPLAPDTPDTSLAVFRGASGDLKTYTLRWTKWNLPLENLSPLDSPFLLSKTASKNALAEDYMEPLRQLRNLSWSNHALRSLRPAFASQTEKSQEIGNVLGIGSRTPRFSLPAGFQLRLGTAANHFFFSGTYMLEGKRIGFIRIPDFDPANPPVAFQQFLNEVAFFKANTDGLVVDLKGNPGGTCYGLDYAKLLIPERFFYTGHQILASNSALNQFQSALNFARIARAEPWVIDTYEFYVNEVRAALQARRAMTGPIPLCQPMFSSAPAAETFEHQATRSAAGQVLAYDKPVIFLVDEFSASHADLFPAVMQDNRRGLVVGTRTGGLGGSVVDVAQSTALSESSARVTVTLLTRRQDVVTNEFPTSAYIENIGVRPDRELEYMTRENLLQRGAPFVNAFSRIILEEINKQR